MRRPLAACLLAATAALAAGPAAAQPVGREIPEGFVLPGPPPTGDPAPAGADPAAPREIPPGFVLPGPPPTGGPVGGDPTAPREIPEGFAVPGPPPTGGQPAAGGATAGRHAAADPDWPCIQRKVPSLDAAAIWTGPALAADGADWHADAEVAALVSRLAQRRLPLAGAEGELAAFAAALAPEARAKRLPLLFAGLFETMDGERSEIIEGVERYARRQKAMAEQIRGKMAELGARRADPAADPAALAQQQQDLEWAVRIFNDRRASLATICEVPRLVEQRLFALGRAATAALGPAPAREAN